MSMETSMIAVVGYDISRLSGYIEELENGKKEWEDGIPEYSLNYRNVEIGYDHRTKSMFGKVVYEFDANEAEETGTFEKIAVADLEKHRAEIWEKYKLFLFDHTKITDDDKHEPLFVLNFISWWS